MEDTDVDGLPTTSSSLKRSADFYEYSAEDTASCTTQRDKTTQKHNKTCSGKKKTAMRKLVPAAWMLPTGSGLRVTSYGLEL